MRLLLLPLTTQRSIIYCQRLALPPVRTSPRLDERIANKGSAIWSNFEKSDKKWKQKIVQWTGKLLDTIPVEENALKTIPPQNTYLRKLQSSTAHISDKKAAEEDLTHKLEPIELLYPRSSRLCPNFPAALELIQKNASKAQRIHRKQIIWCFLGLPLTIPFAINPFIPNFPGIYLVYRIWSNWKALKAAKHLDFLLENQQLKGITIPELDQVYKDHHVTDQLSHGLADDISSIFNDEQLRKELQQAVRQTTQR